MDQIRASEQARSMSVLLSWCMLKFVNADLVYAKNLM